MLSIELKKAISHAFKHNLKPALTLQFFALMMVLSYFYVPSSQAVFSFFSDLKQEYGFSYAFVSTSIFGGLVPFCYLFLTKQLSEKNTVIWLFLFYLIFWGIKGVEVDIFYRFQGQWFGYANDWQTIVTKTSVDQFIYSALWAAPSITISYLWMENNFNFSQTIKAIDRKFIFVTIPSIVISNWIVWIPAVSIVYLMPADLQIPLFNLILCFWVLMLAVLNKKAEQS